MERNYKQQFHKARTLELVTPLYNVVDLKRTERNIFPALLRASLGDYVEK